MIRESFERSVRVLGGPCPRLRLLTAGLLAVILGARVVVSLTAPPSYSHAEILRAIRMVESSGRENPPDGDNGLAIGPYQIHRVYWQDAGVPGDYQDCRRRDYAERVIAAYMQRWVPDAWRYGDAEVIARTHNGGPEGRNKRATDRYWQKVEAELRR